MKISPLSFNLNKQTKNKTQNIAKTSPMMSDSVSFGAKLPEKTKAQLKYLELFNHGGSNGRRYFYESQDPEVLTLLEQLKEDENVSAEFKSRVVTPTAFSERIEKGKSLDDYDSQVALKMWEIALKNEKEFQSVINSRHLKFASLDMTQELLKSHQEEQIFYGEEPYPFMCAQRDKKEAILSNCDYDLQRKIFLSPYVATASRIDKDLMELAPDKQTRVDIFQVPQRNNANILHGISAINLLRILDEKEGSGLINYPLVLARLLLQQDKNGNIPIATCDNDTVAILLDASPSEEILKAQLTAKNNDDEFPINVCDPKVIVTMVQKAPDAKTRKILLTTKDSSGRLPIQKLEEPEKQKLIKLSPDDETKKIQLTTPDSDGKLPISPENALWFLKQSPDHETMLIQMNKKIKYVGRYEKIIAPAIGFLRLDDYFRLLDGLKDGATIKEILLSKWEKTEVGLYVGDKTTTKIESVADKIKHGYKCDRLGWDDYAHGKQPVQKLFEYLILAIEDDSTTNEEALELISLYKDSVTSTAREYLGGIETYLKSKK